MQHGNVLENLFPPPPHMTCTDICGTIRPAYLCQLNVHFLPFHIHLHKGLRNTSLVLWDFLLIIEFMHACVCTMNGERMVGHPEHPVCLSGMEYTHHCGVRALFIGYNGRLSYSHVIWRKKDNLSFCSSIPLKAVKDKIWFMWNPWDTRCAFGDKQEQVHPPSGFLLTSLSFGFQSVWVGLYINALHSARGFSHRTDFGSSQVELQYQLG